MKDGELIHEALRRELQEETGISIGDPVSTAFLMHIDSARFPSAFAAAFEVDTWDGDIAPEDPDIHQAAFFPLAEAIEQIGKLKSEVQREPIVGYLNGTVPTGTMWVYRVEGDKETLLGRW